MTDQPESEGRDQSDSETFEQSLRRLEQIVGRLEEGNLPLEESLELYERGIGAYRRCQKLLLDADARVQKLVETLEGELEEEPFDASAESDETSGDREAGS